jgi:hypothetical protein
LLGDRSSAVWRGMIKVDPGAQRTDAFQESRNLLLSKKAHADAIPGLEILANDVRCTHAAAVAQIDRDQVFYLRAHGLDEARAQRLVIEGFLQALVERFEEGPVRDAVGAAVERRLDVRIDPRVAASDADLRLQTDLSLACYRAYQQAQEMREAIDAEADRRTDRREQLLALRGAGTPENPDLLYDSISAADPNQETVVGLQQKLLFMLNLLQSADARPSAQAADAVKRLTAMLPLLNARWARVRQ